MYMRDSGIESGSDHPDARTLVPNVPFQETPSISETGQQPTLPAPTQSAHVQEQLQDEGMDILANDLDPSSDQPSIERDNAPPVMDPKETADMAWQKQEITPHQGEESRWI